MLPEDEISSTEKLLTLIRKQSFEEPKSSVPEKNKFRLSDYFNEERHFNVAIDIRNGKITLIKMSPTSKGEFKLLDCRQVRFDGEFDAENAEMIALLKKTLIDFCSSLKRFNLWAFIFSERFDVKHVLVPKTADKQIANSIYWIGKRDLSFDDADTFFNYEILGDVTEKGIGRTAVMIYIAPKSEITKVNNLFAKVGFPLAGVSVQPFAIQNLFRHDWLSGSGSTVASLYIGIDYSEINIFRRGTLAVSRRIKSCVKSMAESLVEQIQGTEKEYLVLEGGVINENKAVELLRGNVEDIEKKIKKEEVFELIEPACERLSRQVERTFEHYALSFSNDNISTIFLSAELNAIEPVSEYIEHQIKIDIEMLNIFIPGHPYIGSFEVPELQYDQVSITPVVGLGLSENIVTPNLLIDYKEKERVKKVSGRNKASKISIAAFAILCIIFFFFLVRLSANKNHLITDLKSELASQGPRINQGLIQEEANRLKNFQSIQKRMARKYQGIAIIKELVELTPYNIQLSNVAIELGNIQQLKRQSGRVVKIEGKVFKESGGDSYETILGNFIMALENSPIFKSPSVKDKGLDDNEEYGKHMKFILHMEFEAIVIP